jgi:type VI secretion system protein ImpK
MSDDDDDRTVFGQSLPTPPARPKSALRTPVDPDEDDGTILAPRPARPGEKATAQLPLVAALQHKGRTAGKASNPVLAVASDLLEVLGLLRTGLVEMQSKLLHEHLQRAILMFEEEARSAGVSEQDNTDARYALAATCDDIAQNLPGTDLVFWQRHSLTVQFFDDPNPGVGFFTRLHRLSGNPGQHALSLEVMFVCLALGFEGQYRAAPDGPVALASLRKDLYNRIRNVVPRAHESMSLAWAPVVLARRRRHGLVPMWIIAGVGAAMVVALYAALAWTLTKEAHAAQAAIIDLHDPNAQIEIERVTLPDEPAVPEVVVYEAPETGQVERVRAQLEAEIAAGLTTVSEEGDFIALRLGSALQFGAGAANLTEESPIISRIATVLEREPGSIIVEGHSDNIPLSGRGRYKTNEELSAARAQAVRDVLARYMSDPSRMSVVGAGSAKPLDRANTPAARSRNRRVDILLLKEQRL